MDHDCKGLEPSHRSVSGSSLKLNLDGLLPQALTGVFPGGTLGQ